MNEGSIGVGDLVGLDGSGSHDTTSKPGPLTYAWRFLDKPAGSVAAWTSVDLPRTGFEVDLEGEYTVGLTVYAGKRSSDEAELVVDVVGCGATQPNVSAIASAPASPITGDVIALSATAEDPDNGELCALVQDLNYSWTLSRAPATSATTLLRADTAWPSFAADVPGDYEVTLVVTDDTGRSSEPSRWPIVVSDCGSAAPVIDGVQVEPASPHVGASVDLALSLSDGDNGGACGLAQALTVSSALITQPAGSAVSLEPSVGPTPAFVPDAPGTYVVRATVEDETGRSSFRDTTVEVRDCGGRAPQLDALVWTPAAPSTGDRVVAAITASDLDATEGCAAAPELSVTTRVVSAPPGGTTAMDPADGLSPSLVANVPGTWTFRTTVTDETGRSTSWTSRVDVSSCGDASPEVSSVVVTPDAPHVGDAVSLWVSASDADLGEGCGAVQQLGLSSSWVSLPPGSRATLDPAVGASPAFVADVAGVYVVRTVVDDGTGRTGFADTAVSVSACGSASPVVDSVSWSPSAPLAGDEVSALVSASDADEGCGLPTTLAVTSWIASAPPGSAASLAPADGWTPAFVADVPGTYEIRTSVTDETGRTSLTTSEVTVGSCGASSPSVDGVVWTPAAPVTHDLVVASVSASDADIACGTDQTLTAASRIVSSPAGSTATLTPADGWSPAFVADAPGTYVVASTVTDSTGREATLFSSVQVGLCGSQAPRVDDVTASPAAPQVGAPVALAVVVSDDDAACGVAQALTVTSTMVSSPAGSTASLAPSAGLSPAFVPDVPGAYVIRTTVVDGTGLTAAATTTVAVGACGSAAPSVDAVGVAPSAPHVQDSVVLSVAVSDADNGACAAGQDLTVTSTLVSAPAGSSAALVPAMGLTLGFVADVAGSYVVRTVVDDGTGRAASALTVVTVDACGSAAPTVDLVSVAPIAPQVNDSVVLGVVVSDADNDACAAGQELTVTSTLVSSPAGSTAALTPSAGVTPGFVPDVAGPYVVRTVVEDGTGRAGSTLTVVTVDACGSAAPVLGDPQVTPALSQVGDVVALTLSATDADAACGQAQVLTFSTSLVGAPAGSAAALAPSVGDTPAFVPDLPGLYTLRVLVEDGTGRYDTADVDVTVGACGTAAPTVDAVVWTPASPATGALVTGSVAVSDADNGACGLGQTWTVVSELIGAPPGSSAALAPGVGTTPAFVADAPGVFTVRTTVTDELGLSSSRVSTVSVSACGDHAPVALAGFLIPAAPAAAQADGGTVTVGDVVQLTSASSTDADQQPPCSLPEVLSATWTFDRLPAGSRASFNQATLTTPSFTPDVAGTYAGAVVVTDGVYSARATFSIVAIPATLVTVAPGFEVTFVAGDDRVWAGPKGLTLDSAGQIYVVQSRDNAVTVTDPRSGATSTFAWGGTLDTRGGLEDIVYAPTISAWLVSTSDRVVKVDAAGVQSTFYSVGSPRSLSVYTPRGQGTPRLLVASRSNGRIEQVALSNGAGLGGVAQSGNIDELYGHDAAVIGNADVYFLGDTNNGELRRWTSATDVALSRSLSTPRDVVRGPSGSVYVADSEAGAVYRVTDCGTNDCGITTVAFGDWAPWGLTLADNNTLYVTDNQGDALYRIFLATGL